MLKITCNPLSKRYEIWRKKIFVSFIISLISGPLSAQNYEINAGTVVDTDLDCAVLGTDTIVITGRLIFEKTQGREEPTFLSCPNVQFQDGAEIVFDSDFHLRASNNLSGKARLIGFRAVPTGAENALQYAARASNGRNGRLGAYGGNGANCLQALFTVAPKAGEDGEHGQPGMDGRNGRSGDSGDHGHAGPRVSVIVGGVSDDAELLIDVTGSDGANGGNGADGQDGGAGGNGGNGGDGGNGGYCQPSKPGGNGGNAGAAGRGGNGGRGGDGGDGGEGGQVLVVLSQNAAQLNSLSIVNDGGSGGAPGVGGARGKPGSPGFGGSPGKGGGQFQQRFFFPAARDGMYGADGSRSPSGADGKTGSYGSNGSWGSGFTKIVSTAEFDSIYAMSVLSDDFLRLYKLDLSDWR
ncbi:hypothetical protein [Ruegeria sp. HKCCA5014]|uniref:hypothetical protein n=1 Tax=Ruegeria sp. HKCCA5014 TaxID=2682980 RepID=UPI00148897B0|nr:hypothetical protein [Ruegeria sp. HKCCA5014]